MSKINITEVKNLNKPELEIFSKLNESQLVHYYEPKEGIFIAESPIVIKRALEAGFIPISAILDTKELDNIPSMLLEKYSDIPFYTAPTDILMNITGFNLTRGMLCAMRRKSNEHSKKELERILKNSKRIAVLEEVVNPTNVGAIFRSAAALNMDAVLLTKGCADPLYRRAIRVSMGNVFQIPWTYICSDFEDWKMHGIDLLKENGFASAAMALSDDSVSISDKKLLSEKKLALILGTEGEGLNQATINNCDYVVKIPMARGVDSLNVAAASAVAFYQITLGEQL